MHVQLSIGLCLAFGWVVGCGGGEDTATNGVANVESLSELAGGNSSIAGAAGSWPTGGGGSGNRCPAQPGCYPLNRVASATMEGCPCERSNACTEAGILTSKCEAYPSTCGYLYCIKP